MDFYSKTPQIVAEIGNNHEGDVLLAKKLIKQAKHCGADAVKLQSFVTENFIFNKDIKIFKKFKKFELSKKNFVDLAHYAKKIKISFFSTPLDIETAKFIDKYVSCFKIASGDNHFWDLIDFVIKTGKVVIISTGGINNKQLIELVNFLKKYKRFRKNIILLHCVSSYPVPIEKSSLGTINLLKKTGFRIGYSDHVKGNDASKIALTMNCKIIEKHFTLDKNFSSFRDHALSADPKDLLDLVRFKNVLISKDRTSEKKILNIEKGIKKFTRRSACAKHNIKAKQVLTEKDIIFLRSIRKGISNKGKIIGKFTKKPIDKGELILNKYFK